MLKGAGYEVKETVRYITPLVGSAIHAGADWLNQDKIRTGLEPTVDVIRAACEHSFDKLQQMYAKDLESHDVKFTIKFSNFDIIRAHIDEYVLLYATQILPQRQLQETEKHFHHQLNEQYHFKSTLDSYGHGTLYDLKTGQVIQKAYHQIGIYTYLLQTIGYEVNKAQLDYIIRKKEGNPPEHVIVTYNPQECMVMAQYATARLMQDLNEFQQTQDINVLAINPRSESCNSLFCPLFNTTSCSGWKKQ
jgi:hypothetical protein